MITQSCDTNLEVEKIWISLFSKLTDEERFSKMVGLSSIFIRLSKKAIAEANPELNKTGVNLLYARYNYGNDLAEKLHFFMEARNDSSR